MASSQIKPQRLDVRLPHRVTWELSALGLVEGRILKRPHPTVARMALLSQRGVEPPTQSN